MGVGEPVVPGVVPEVAHRRVAAAVVSGHQRREVDRSLDEGPSRESIAAADADAAGAAGEGVAGMEVESADEVGAGGAGGLRGEGTRRGGEAEESFVLRRGSGGGDEEQKQQGSRLTCGSHGDWWWCDAVR